jgi:hypothetical protein
VAVKGPSATISAMGHQRSPSRPHVISVSRSSLFSRGTTIGPREPIQCQSLIASRERFAKNKCLGHKCHTAHMTGVA